MSIKTIGEAWQLGWRVTARCAFGNRDGMKSVRECLRTYDLDMSTLIWTRGKNFPLALLASRLKCPRCGSRSISLLFHTPKEPATVAFEHHPPRNPEWKGFESRAGGARWKVSKPFHVALEDSYVRRNWDEIDGLCKLNGIPFEPTRRAHPERRPLVRLSIRNARARRDVLGSLRRPLAAAGRVCVSRQAR